MGRAIIMCRDNLPDGSPAPKFLCTAVADWDGEIRQVLLTEEWWCGKQTDTIEKTADAAFYGIFDKHPFKITKIERVPDA